MDFDTAKEFVEKYIDKTNEKYKDFYLKILQDIDKLQRDENIEVNILEARGVVRELINDLFFGRCGDERLNFFEGFIYIIYNWNNNSIRDEDIATYCFCVQQFLTAIVTIRRSLSNIKTTCSFLRRYQSWLPPVEDVSKKYLELLLDKYEKQSVDSNSPELCAKKR